MRRPRPARTGKEDAGIKSEHKERGSLTYVSDPLLRSERVLAYSSFAFNRP